jgi:hypothetical protein
MRRVLLTLTTLAVVGDAVLLPFYPQYFASRFGVNDASLVGNYLAAMCLVVMLALPAWAALARRVDLLRLLPSSSWQRPCCACARLQQQHAGLLAGIAGHGGVQGQLSADLPAADEPDPTATAWQPDRPAVGDCPFWWHRRCLAGRRFAGPVAAGGYLLADGAGRSAADGHVPVAVLASARLPPRWPSRTGAARGGRCPAHCGGWDC